MGLAAVVLVGGVGSRLRPLTDIRPKPMLPIVDEPFLAHQLALLRRHGIVDVTFACGFLPQKIVAGFGDGSSIGMRLSYVVEPEPLDTAGAIGFAARTIEDDGSELLVCNGDILTGLDIAGLVAAHRAANATATIACTEVEDPSRYGLVQIDSTGAVEAFIEKPGPDGPAAPAGVRSINAGTYVFERSVLELIPENQRCNLEREIFPQLVGAGLHAVVSDAYWNDIGTFPSYLRANVDMLRGRVEGAGGDAGAAYSSDTARAHTGVSPEAVIEGPVWIGPDAVVESGAHIGPDAVICAGARVGHGARVVRSVALEGATIDAEAQVVDSILGDESRVDARCSVSDASVIGPRQRVQDTIVRGRIDPPLG